ncbi:MAG: prolyl oligopeptidase family serine peptidase, partial [Caulobacterales bacterium]|nr:prolyl oligopeptidase family serine peptidase [Caulobacterales bacterium]
MAPMFLAALAAASMTLAALAAAPAPAEAETEGEGDGVNDARNQPDDPRQWLEEVEGEAALDAVRAWNARTLDLLQADPRFAELEADALAIVNAEDKIAYGAYRGGWVYNFWQDETNTRGLLRRTSLESYLSETPEWSLLLDIDALAETEDANWVFKGSGCLPPAYDRCLLTLSDGGKDAAVRREWSHEARAFVEGGFSLPEAKASASWKDEDTLYVATDWGEGALTESGYPFIVKELARGESLEEARELIRGEPTDVAVFPFRLNGDGGAVMMAARSITFYDSEQYWLPEGRDPVRLPLPRKSSPQAYIHGELVFTIQEDWTPTEGGPTFPSGALLSFDLDAFMEAEVLPEVKIGYEPDARSSIEGVSASRSKLIVTVFENVVGRAFAYDLEDGAWTRTAIALPDKGSPAVASAYRDSDVVFMNHESFLSPSTLWRVDVAAGEAEPAKALPARFEAEGLTVDQFEAVSSDGEKIPYFVLRKADIALDGSNPTLLYGYGGFQISLTPGYSGVRGKLWLERGGVYVLANIRGGGEFGPDWHQAGLKTERQIIYDDFIAVAEDLIARGVTSPPRLGIMGGSNGGLLMGVMFTQRPDLFNAVVCQVPLLDMLRFDKLLAGASWTGE